jgi:hypothetical protein
MWAVTFRERPRLPAIDTWGDLDEAQRNLRLIDPERMRSPTYPGIIFELSPDGSMFRAQSA